MKLRAPAVPLITVDPYFSVWSAADKLTDAATEHWTGKPNTILGTAIIDGSEYVFMGKSNRPEAPVMEQTALNITALTTEYKFTAGGIELTANFSTPLLPDDYYYFTRPISYLKLSYKSLDGASHKVSARIAVSEEICLDWRGQMPVTTEIIEKDGIKMAKMGSVAQRVLARRGDDIRIDWGYFYLATKGGKVYTDDIPFAFDERFREHHRFNNKSVFMKFVVAENTVSKNGTLFTFAYDDIESMIYFGEHLKSYWNRDGQKIEDEIVNAFADYREVYAKAVEFGRKMRSDATKAGGEKYADMLELAYRQVCAAHKLVLDKDGTVLYISKECHSNGCAATVDISYPSIPMFLLYSPELVNGMIRPIIKYATSDRWPFDFAPHDAGQYPHVNGQVYSGGLDPSGQMPIEECGNMLVMFATSAVAKNDVSYAAENIEILEKWVKYLEDNGRDPANQLCTDDFAGHLAHNCNLSLKAISGIIGLSIIYKMMGNDERSAALLAEAKDFASDWAVRAANGDGSYRLAFDKPGSFSMKYNIVWDKLFGTNVMSRNVIDSELESYKSKTMPYGLPLDNRKNYTKSDWLIWTATLAKDKAGFMALADTLWNAYNYSESRMPMTDWYWTTTGLQSGFRHRSVQGGLFIKLLEYTGKMKVEL